MKPHILLKSAVLPNSTVAAPLRCYWSSSFPEPTERGEMKLRPSLYRISSCSKTTPAAPKPPKKRYLEENYSQNNYVQDKLKRESLTPLPMNGMSIKSVDPNDLMEMEPNENLVPAGKNDGAQDSWRKRLLCWEQLPEDESLSSTKEMNNNDSPDKKSSSEDMGRRRGSARACKGQKYREFMWTNIIHHRRKSSRWELCQDAIPISTKISDTNTANSSKSLSSSLTKGALSSRNVSSLGIDGYYKKKKNTRKSVQVKSKETEEKDVPSDAESNKSDSSSITFGNLDEGNDDGKKNSIVGSKKRKLRKQSIRRLEPGTSFKDTSVVEECSLDALATAAVKKKKLRSSCEQ